jgi:hypothetical protein
MDRKTKELTLFDVDVDLEVIPLGYNILERNFATLGIFDTVTRQLLLPLLLPIAVLAAVVLRRNDDTGLLVSKVRDNVTPTLVIVDAKGDDEFLVSGVGHETKGATSSAAAHLEHVGLINFAPCPAVSEVPDRLFCDTEECVRVDMEGARGDCVTHSRKK